MLSFLKAQFRSPTLSEGSEFALGMPSGTPAEDDARWRVAAVRMLRGIPHALKDIYETAGVLTTGHSHLKKDYVPAIDAETVRRLKDAGAIILGKVGTHEFANGAMTPDQPFPPVLNPWNTRYQPGGSSSGSGAAVAAQEIPAERSVSRGRGVFMRSPSGSDRRSGPVLAASSN